MGKLYPVGIQNFESLRNDGYFYVDKTEQVLFPEPSEKVRQESACQHTGGIFPGEEGAVRGTCGAWAGEGVDRISDTASGPEHSEI